MPEVLSRTAPACLPSMQTWAGSSCRARHMQDLVPGHGGLGSWPGEGKQDSEAAASARIRKGKKLVILPACWCCKVGKHRA